MSYPIPYDCPKCSRPMSWVGGIVSRMKGYYAAECPCGFSGGVAATQEGAAHKWIERVKLVTESKAD